MEQIFNEDYLRDIAVLMIGSVFRTTYAHHMHRRWLFVQLLLEGGVPHKDSNPEFQDYIDYVWRFDEYDSHLKLFFPRNAMNHM